MGRTNSVVKTINNITEVQSDIEGNKYINVTYTDGTNKKILLPSGGSTETTVKSITQSGNGTTLTITYTDGTSNTVTVGSSEKVVRNITQSGQYLTVTFTDNSTKQIYLPTPTLPTVVSRVYSSDDGTQIYIEYTDGYTGTITLPSGGGGSGGGDTPSDLPTNFVDAYNQGYDFSGKPITFEEIYTSSGSEFAYRILFSNGYKIEGSYRSAFYELYIYKPDGTTDYWSDQLPTVLPIDYIFFNDGTECKVSKFYLSPDGYPPYHDMLDEGAVVTPEVFAEKLELKIKING